MRKTVHLFLVLFFLVIVSAGCAASNTKTVRTETTAYPIGGTTVQKETTVTTTQPPESSGGVLSGTVNVVGEVIALPFRAVGGLLSAIF
jgi:hypothetical protein